MKSMTPFGKLIIILAIIAGLYFGFRYLQGQGLIGKSSTEKPITNTDSSSVDPKTETANTSTEATETVSAFSYTPPSPVNGKLKGVVELGASGFNSFIITVDAQKNWKLEKAEFGNSLVKENMATDDDVRIGLKKYISGMLDFGVSGKDIHFVVSSGAVKEDVTQKIIRVLKSMGYFVNTVTPEQEGTLGLKCVLPKEYEDKSFVVDIGSGNTKISWKENGKLTSVESYGAKYFQNKVEDKTVYDEVVSKIKQIPSSETKTCFIIGGVPFELAKQVRKGKERYTILDAPDAYKLDKAKSKAGLNIYKAVADGTGCKEFVFDWDANFTIGFLLDLPN